MSERDSRAGRADPRRFLADVLVSSRTHEPPATAGWELPGSDGAALLVTLSKGTGLDPINRTLVKAGASVRSAALVGSHASRYTVAAGKK